MNVADEKLSEEFLDEQTIILYLQTPPQYVVLLQGVFELYEGVAVVRTVDLKRSYVCIVVPVSMRNDCLRILEEIKSMVHWRPLPLSELSESERQRYLGYFSKNRAEDKEVEQC